MEDLTGRHVFPIPSAPVRPEEQELQALLLDNEPVAPQEGVEGKRPLHVSADRW